MVEPRPALWATLGLIITLVASVAVWIVLIVLFGWPVALAVLGIPALIWVLLELRHRRR